MTNNTPRKAMSDSRERRDPLAYPQGSNCGELSGTLTRSLRLSRQEAANGLQCISHWLSSSNELSSPELESLRNALEDACWLARWKREAVYLELCPAMLPGMLQALVQLHNDESSVEVATALETIIRKISAS